MNLITC